MAKRSKTPARAPARAPERSTADRILDAAEELIQNRGFNGISYADIAAVVGVTKANLHHHFGSKAELGDALLARYATNFYRALGDIDAAPGTAAQRLVSYAELYAGVVKNQRLCLCGVLAAEFDTLSEPMQAAVERFFADNERWLARTIRSGRQEGSVSNGSDERDAARTLMAGLEGAMLVTRPKRDYAQFRRLARTLLQGLGVDFPAQLPLSRRK